MSNDTLKKEFESHLETYGWHSGAGFSLIGALDLMKYDMVKKIFDQNVGDSKGVS